MKTMIRLSMALLVLLISDCFGSHGNDDQNGNQADGGDREADSSIDKSDNKKSIEKNIEDFFELPPEEGAEIAAELFCDFADNCGRSTVSCEVSISAFASEGGSGATPEECREVHCEVGYAEDSLSNDCREEVTVTVQRGLECADLTSQQERGFKECLSALLDRKCVEITDEMLREYEAAIARRERSGGFSNFPEACLLLEDVFECANEEPSGAPSAMRCEPGQYAQCTCANGDKGIQSCLPDQTFSPCDCRLEMTPTAGTPSMSGAFAGTAGAGGYVAGAGGPPPPSCVVDEIRACICPHGTEGTQSCLDGWSFSECDCPLID